MTTLDAIILGIIIIFIVAIGLSGRQDENTAEDFFLAGRNLRWYQIGFSLFATNFSASAIIGLTGAAYITGIAIYNYEWAGIITIVIFAWLLVRVIRKTEAYTIAEFLDQRYDMRIKTIYSVFIIFLIVFVDMAASLYAGGLLLSQFLPHFSPTSLILIVMGLAATYSILGGLKAISRTDIFQTLIIIIGALCVSYYTLDKVGGWKNFIKTAPEGYLTLFRPLDDRAVPWVGIFTGISVLCAYFWFVNQNMVQWVLSAKTDGDARRGLLLAGFLKLVVLFIIIFPGVAAIAFIPDLSAPDRVYPALMVELLPPGILGLVLAAFLAALMSNADATVHAASTILTMDFVKPKYPALSSRQLVWVGRGISITIIGLGAIWAPMIGSFGTLFEYIQGLLSYAVAPFVVVYLGAVFWKKVTARGALAALISGLLGALLLAGLQISGITDFHYLYVPLPLSLLCTLVLIIVSHNDQSVRSHQEWVWTRISYKNFPKVDLLLTIGLIVLVGLQLIYFG